MAHRNTIRCDRYGCRTGDFFEGEPSPEESFVRFHVLGWRFTEVDGRELHHCRFTSDWRSVAEGTAPRARCY
jgi:hypothetical protein